MEEGTKGRRVGWRHVAMVDSGDLVQEVDLVDQGDCEGDGFVVAVTWAERRVSEIGAFDGNIKETRWRRCSGKMISLWKE